MPRRSSLPIGVTATALLWVLARSALAAGTVGVWSQALPAVNPPGVVLYTFTFDSARSKSVLFGGYLGTTAASDTWEWDGAAWSHVCTSPGCRSGAPSPRFDHAAAYDIERQRTVVHGGCTTTSAAAACDTPLGDTWEWDGSSWQEVCTTASCRANAPGLRVNAAMAYDSVRGRIVLFGGVRAPGEPAQGTWEWDGTQWSNVCDASCAAPSPRLDPAMTYDAARHEVLLYGGEQVNGGSAALADLWAWDGIAWKEECSGADCAATTPGTRTSATLTFNPDRGVALLWGGCVDMQRYCVTPEPVMWSWNGTAWASEPSATMDAPSPPPAALGEQHLVFDPAPRRVYLLTSGLTTGSGQLPVPITSVFTYYARGEACAADSACDTGICADGVCCESSCTDPCDTCDSPGDEGVCQSRPSCVASCDGDHTVTTSDGKSSVDCSPYGCNPGGTCKTACTTPSDCAAPNICNTKGRCIPPPTGAASTTAACSVGRGAGGAWVVLAGLGALLAARVKRRRR